MTKRMEENHSSYRRIEAFLHIYVSIAAAGCARSGRASSLGCIHQHPTPANPPSISQVLDA